LIAQELVFDKIPIFTIKTPWMMIKYLYDENWNLQEFSYLLEGVNDG
jgi:hypothetical protein